MQSLKAHKEDIITDFIIPEAKILVFTETWLNDSEKIELPKFQCIVQSKRENVDISLIPHSLIIADISSASQQESCGDICAAECRYCS